MHDASAGVTQSTYTGLPLAVGVDDGTCAGFVVWIAAVCAPAFPANANNAAQNAGPINNDLVMIASPLRRNATQAVLPPRPETKLNRPSVNTSKFALRRLN